MPKPVLAVLVVLFLSLLFCAAFTEAADPAPGGSPRRRSDPLPLTAAPVRAGTP
ncbi:hypothetical protein WN990_28685 [Kitasatospora purpeofusca]|uniref:hypothetical protein n=1 Tax=Kitasatospora purpeofusca TaxID=67352 RepID=UPI0030F12A48